MPLLSSGTHVRENNTNMSHNFNFREIFQKNFSVGHPCREHVSDKVLDTLICADCHKRKLLLTTITRKIKSVR